MQSKKLAFKNRQGVNLAARLDLPEEGAPIAYALFAHCFTCGKNVKAAYHISQALTRGSIAVLRFDFSGIGESGGDFGQTSFSSNVGDLEAAAQYLADRFRGPQILIGHSLGGAAVLQAAAQIPASKAVAVIGAPGEPGHVARTLGLEGHRLEAGGTVEVAIGGRPFPITRQFVDDLDRPDFKDTIRTLDRALLILHSPLDRIVGIDHAGYIFQSARHPKSFFSLDRADHLLSDPQDALYAGSMIAVWARKYLDPRPPSDS